MEASAMDRVLGVTELLENILLKLPIRDIFQAQRVCKQWKTLIDTSPSLQQAMWLVPLSLSSPPAEYETYPCPEDLPLFRPYAIDRHIVKTKHLNPVLPQRYGGAKLMISGLLLHWEPFLDANTLAIPAADVDSFSPGRKGYAQANWGKMQVCKPLITNAQAFCFSRVGGGSMRISPFMELHNDTGVTMEDVVKAIAGLQSRQSG
ncbi:hypothetical protein BU16DRAFT_155039 [Lophium mytilinum]|uniref:F-box domain-containing protein n=1 Tax=Lophium mytilinum TaxID=390894 RepID=A0A6A6QEG1_9PEZI|nr:hypothetical protein BU16DRAFT_155039 [Lophium mytilinum]